MKKSRKLLTVPDANCSLADQSGCCLKNPVGAVGAVGSHAPHRPKEFAMKKGKLSQAVMSAKGRPKKHAAIRIRLGKDEAGTQFLEIRSGERTAIIAATDLLLARRELAAKLIAQGVPVFDHRTL